MLTKLRPRLTSASLLAVAGVLAWAASASAASFTVNSPTDAVDATPGDGHCVATAPAAGKCTLRAAIQEADAHPDHDTVTLPAGHYVLSIPGANEDAAATGDLDLTNAITIAGAGARTTKIDANGIDRVFEVLAGVTASIRGVTITGGSAASGDGGGITDAGTLTVTDSSISRNSLGPKGGDGGGVATPSGSSLTLVRSLVFNNLAYNGGGIENGGALSVVDSTIADNHAGDSTPGDNGDGGGLDWGNPAHTSVSYSTIVGNDCWNGSGCGAGINGQADVSNSILAGNTESQAAGPSVPGSCGNGAAHVVDQGHNVDDVDTNCNLTDPTSQPNVKPKLGPLANNGGPTDSFAVLLGSPAINKGDIAACFATDQRGLARPRGGACDIGAFEFARPVVTIATPRDGARYGQGKRVLAAFSCTEAGSRGFIRSCLGTVANGHTINTSKPGTKSFTVTATDKAGNRVSKTVHYTVKKKRKETHHH